MTLPVPVLVFLFFANLLIGFMNIDSVPLGAAFNFFAAGFVGSFLTSIYIKHTQNT